MPDRRKLQSWMRMSAICGIFAAGLGVARADNVELPVPKITVYPGDVIGGESLEMKPMRLRDERLPVARGAEAVIGKVARRTLIAGKPIPIAYLGEQQVVRQGKSVRVSFREGALTISGVGIALQSGGVGDAISLRNVDSGAVIRGIVEADGTVRVAGP